MSETQRIAEQLKRALEGGAWHGPALLELLAGVSARQASSRAIPSAHSIWEIVLHISVWDEVVRRRIEGESIPTLPPEQDWPAPASGEAKWEETKRRLVEGNSALRASVAAFDGSRLDADVPGQTYSFYRMLYGAVEHELYHAGQIALVKKAL